MLERVAPRISHRPEQLGWGECRHEGSERSEICSGGPEQGEPGVIRGANGSKAGLGG